MSFVLPRRAPGRHVRYACREATSAAHRGVKPWKRSEEPVPRRAPRRPRRFPADAGVIADLMRKHFRAKKRKAAKKEVAMSR